MTSLGIARLLISLASSQDGLCTKWRGLIISLERYSVKYCLHSLTNECYWYQQDFAIIFWQIAIAIGVAVFYGIYPYIDETKVPDIDKIVTVFYGSFHRFAWAVVVSWVICACIFGYGGKSAFNISTWELVKNQPLFVEGTVNDLLSWSAFTPLSRLSYCVYLIHLNYLSVYMSRSRTLLYYTVLDQIHQYFGVLFVAYGLAFITSISVEIPFRKLVKLMCNSKSVRCWLVWLSVIPSTTVLVSSLTRNDVVILNFVCSSNTCVWQRSALCRQIDSQHRLSVDYRKKTLKLYQAGCPRRRTRACIYLITEIREQRERSPPLPKITHPSYPHLG